jgi:mevalonate kinase
MKYFIPSKTFLTGEYSVLVDGAALGLATNPCFEVAYPNGQTTFFHEKSPASLYLKKNNLQMNVHLRDPYQSLGVQGGFGKSTAEYFAVCIPELLKSKKTIAEIRKEYRSLFSKDSVRPSGIDLVFQYLGEVTFAQPKENKFASAAWRFPELDFFVLSTGFKIPTHEHLAKLNLKDLSDLPLVSDQVIDCYLNKTQDQFLAALNEWSETLQQMNLTYESVVEQKSALKKIKEILLIKPCGALGADVMLIFFDKNNKGKVEHALRALKLKIQSSVADISEGLIKYVD